MKKPFMVIAGIALLLTAAAAQYTTQDLIRELSKYHGPYSQTLGQYGIGDTNLYILGYRGTTASYYIKTDNEGYARLYRGRLPLPKIEIWTTEETMDRILASTDPKEALTYAVNNGLVRIRGNGIEGILKVNALKALLTGSGQPLGNLPGTWIQRAAGGPCGPIQYRSIPMGNTVSVIAVCAEPMVCQSGHCIRKPPATVPGKKRPGEICAHGGECATTFCLKIPYSGEYGSNSPATFACSCEQYRYVTTC